LKAALAAKLSFYLGKKVAGYFFRHQRSESLGRKQNLNFPGKLLRRDVPSLGGCGERYLFVYIRYFWPGPSLY
jgi:hypothetical protein